MAKAKAKATPTDPAELAVQETLKRAQRVWNSGELNGMHSHKFIISLLSWQHLKICYEAEVRSPPGIASGVFFTSSSKRSTSLSCSIITR